MKRQLISINEEKCNGCGSCVDGCPEGALQIIAGKARLVGEILCDGLGACLGNCPQHAISTRECEALPYSEAKVIENIAKQGEATVKAHLSHLKKHGQEDYYRQAIDYLQAHDLPVPEPELLPESRCLGERATLPQGSTELKNWPVQLALVNPQASYFEEADLLIVADCVPFAYKNFHEKYLKNKVVLMFCPKLDKVIDFYIEKLAAIFRSQRINSVTLVRMEVLCCGGTELILQKALQLAEKTAFVKINVISINGEII